MRAVKWAFVGEFMTFAFGIAGLLALVSMCGCAGANKEKAEAAYLAEQLQCIDKAETKTEAEVCRAAVKRKWGTK